MKRITIGLIALMGIVFSALGQYHTVGKREIEIGYGINMHNQYLNVQYNRYISKKSILGVELAGELGSIDKSRFQSYSINCIYSFNLYTQKLHRYLKYKYCVKAEQNLGLGYEYVSNAIKNQSMTGIKYNYGIGIDNLLILGNYIYGIKIGQVLNYKSMLGDNAIITYPIVLVEFKHSF